jgi:hypothetical protein
MVLYWVNIIKRQKVLFKSKKKILVFDNQEKQNGKKQKNEMTVMMNS